MVVNHCCANWHASILLTDFMAWYVMLPIKLKIILSVWSIVDIRACYVCGLFALLHDKTNDLHPDRIYLYYVSCSILWVQIYNMCTAHVLDRHEKSCFWKSKTFLSNVLLCDESSTIGMFKLIISFSNFTQKLNKFGQK